MRQVQILPNSLSHPANLTLHFYDLSFFIKTRREMSLNSLRFSPFHLLRGEFIIDRFSFFFLVGL